MSQTTAPRSRAARLRRHTVALARAARDVLTSADSGAQALSVIAPAAMDALGVQGLSLWQREGEALLCRSRYPAVNGDAQAARMAPVASGRRRREPPRVLRIADVQHIGDARWFDLLVLQGVGALLDARVMVDASPWGQLCFEHASARDWHADEAALAGHLADVLGVALDRQRRREAEARLQYLELYDQVSGVANRSLFLAYLEQRLRRLRQRSRNAALLFVDLDRFHAINEVFGERGGDAVLAMLAARIDAATPDDAVIGRLESDCYGVLLPRVDAPWQAIADAQAVLEAIAEPVLRDGERWDVSSSIGIAFADTDAPGSVEEWLRNADLASKDAKAAGRNRLQVFDPDQHQSLVQRLLIERGLREALETGGIEVAYQAEYDLETGGIVGAEALARWRQQDDTLVAASEFIDVAETTGLIDALGRQVLLRACADANGWPPCRDGTPRVVRVNVSARQFADARLLEDVSAALAVSGLPASRLCLEITETTVMGRAEAALGTLRALKALGLRLAIDDFGTGYSSLAYLRRFPVDTLKLDKSLVQDLQDDPVAQAIVASVLALAHALQLELVVEGVEDPAQVPALTALGIRQVQGFLYAKPEAASEFMQRLA
jgi:diguanylate cyclase (GGDEF)-like protein